MQVTARIKRFLANLNFGIIRRIALSIIGWEGGGRISYSQEGEDIIINKYFTSNKGFYVDIGAYHPIKYSNTFLFYKKGWRGINIDATPGAMVDFEYDRPCDINLNVAISCDDDEVDYYIFNKPEYNTFIPENLESAEDHSDVNLAEIVRIPLMRLSDVLDMYVPEGMNIDFMNVDVEGADLKVLMSNNWEVYKPTLIVVETPSLNLINLDSNEIYKYLTSIGYRLVSKLFFSSIFVLDI